MTNEDVDKTITWCEGRISAIEHTLRPNARKYDKNRSDKNKLKLENHKNCLKALEFYKMEYEKGNV